MNKLEKSSTFCVLPFTHRHISPNGIRMLCCISDRFEDRNFEENIAEVKRKMLNDEYVSQCSRCYESEQLGITSYRQSSFYQFKSMIDIDNIQQMPIISFDYRDDVCNLTCASCGPDYSTAYKKLTNIKVISPLKNNNEIANDIIQSANSKTLRHLYWAGGEPFKSSLHWRVMEHVSTIIEEDDVFNEHLSILYNTNMTQITYKNKNIPLFLKRFKNVVVSASIDGTGKVAEYTRNGASWSSLKTNIEQFIDVLGPERVSISTVLSLPVILDIENLLQFAVNNEISIVSQPLMVNPNCQLMHPNIVEFSCLVQIIKTAINHVNNFNISQFSKEQILNTLNMYIANYNRVKITDSIRKDNTNAEQLRKSKNNIFELYDMFRINIIFNE